MTHLCGGFWNALRIHRAVEHSHGFGFLSLSETSLVLGYFQGPESIASVNISEWLLYRTYSGPAFATPSANADGIVS